MDIQAKISALMEQEAFVEAFKQVEDAQDVVDLFGKHGVEVPLEIAEELFQPVEEEEGELSEEALEDVAGGGKVGKFVGKVLGYGAGYGAGYLGGRLAGWSKADSKKYASKCGSVMSTLGGVLGGLAIPV